MSTAEEIIRERFTATPDPRQLTLEEPPLRIGSLFSGYEGLGLGVQAAIGGELAFVSDIDPGANAVLAHRFPDVPNLGDITTTDWVGAWPVDVLTGGFPCQDVSMAGRQAGMRPGTRSGLWAMMAGAIDRLRPSLVVIENVRGLLNADAHSDMEHCSWCLGKLTGQPRVRALGAVLGDLADLGYDAAWQGLTAASVGAPHNRFRVFIVAAPDTDPLGWDGRARLIGQGWWGQPTNGCAPANTGRNGERTRRAIGEVVTGERSSDHPQRRSPAGDHQWGSYGPAISRWATVLGRPAPAPTDTGPKGGQRLSPRFVEWMMGLPDGWVTDVPGLSCAQQLKALGNGVIPQQAEAAIRHLLRRDIWTPTSAACASSSGASAAGLTPTSAQGTSA